jgi:hypothetical protein
VLITEEQAWKLGGTVAAFSGAIAALCFFTGEQALSLFFGTGAVILAALSQYFYVRTKKRR